jgi:serine/threonine protein kinase
VRTYGWYQDRGWLYICMEYCQHLDLGKHLRAHGTLSEEHAKVIAVQVLQGLHQMHKNQIAHRDLKPAVSAVHTPRSLASC